MSGVSESMTGLGVTGLGVTGLGGTGRGFNVVHVASECAPWAASGGLAEVVAALPRAQSGGDIGTRIEPKIEGRVEGRVGGRASVVIPGYVDALHKLEAAGKSPERVGDLLTIHLDNRELQFAAFHVDDDGLDLWLLACAELFDRPGLYGDSHGSYGDNALRFAAFCHAARLLVLRGDLGDVDVVHCHDWHAALVPVIVGVAGGPKTVLTIHNLGYQGTFDKAWLPRIGLPWRLFRLEGLEFHDRINYLKGGINFCDALTTVSPTYAREILTSTHGAHLDGLLRHHAGKLTGILNGIGDAWRPEVDDAIAAKFAATDLTGKKTCRDALCARFGVKPRAGEPVFGIVSRLAWQKGLDLVADIAPLLAKKSVVLLLGSGEPGLEHRFEALAAALPDRIGVHIGYDAAMSRTLFAGCDAMLMPSRYEPCGLAQMQAMRYGTLPVVHATGGLRDSVIHGEDGFVFEVGDAQGLLWACGEALDAYQMAGKWSAMQQAAMTRDFTWTASAARYANVYGSVV